MATTTVPALNVSIAQLDIAAQAFGWTKGLVEFRHLNTEELFYEEARHTYTRPYASLVAGTVETVTVDENRAHEIVHFAWVQDSDNFAMVGNDHAGVEALVQLSQPA